MRRIRLGLVLLLLSLVPTRVPAASVGRLCHDACAAQNLRASCRGLADSCGGTASLSGCVDPCAH